MTQLSDFCLLVFKLALSASWRFEFLFSQHLLNMVLFLALRILQKQFILQGSMILLVLILHLLILTLVFIYFAILIRLRCPQYFPLMSCHYRLFPFVQLSINLCFLEIFGAILLTWHALCWYLTFPLFINCGIFLN